MSASGRLDLSFLKEEEANRILQVLERDEQLRRTERERLRKLKCWKRDVKWLHAASGEWFEEILKKKFKDNPDVRCLVKPPLTHLKKTPKGEPESSRMTTSRNSQPQKNSGPSFLRLRSPLSAFFSFKKSAKQILKPPPEQERHGIFSISGQLPPNSEVKKKFEIYHSARSVKQIASFFEAQYNRAREDITTTATNQLEIEVFQVLGDLDQKLAQEQSHKQTLRNSRLASYKYGRQNAKAESLHNTSEPKKAYTSLSSNDGRETVSLEETHTTYATYQPRKFYEMYSNRQRPVSKTNISKKSFYKKNPSPISPVSNTSTSSSPDSLSLSSLQLSPLGIDLEKTRQRKSRRPSVTSIKWNNAFPSGQSKETGRSSRTQSALDLTELGKSSHHIRVFDVYKCKYAPRVPVSTSNDLHDVNNINNIRTSDNGSTGYYKTDSTGHGPRINYLTQPERNWKEEYKDNSLKNNEKLKTPIENASSNDKETEPTALESELSVQLDASSVTNDLKSKTEVSNKLSNFKLQIKDLLTKANVKSSECKMAIDHERCRNVEADIHDQDIPVDCTLRPGTKTFYDPGPPEVSSSNTSEPEITDVDATNVFLHSRNTSSITSVGLGAQKDSFLPKTEWPRLTLTNHNRSFDAIKKLNSVEHRKSYKIDIPPTDFKSSNISDLENTLGYKRSSLFCNPPDIGGRFAWMNMRRGSNGNRTEVFRSDTLKFQRRNASSLPDLIDQDSETLANKDEVTLLNKSCENVAEYDDATVPETKSSSVISDDSNELELENYSQYEQHENPKNVGSRTFQSLQKPHISSYGSVIDGTVKNLDTKASYPAIPYQGNRLTQKQSKYNHTERFLSDTLKYKKRNASSLPDLIDQESEHDGDYHTSTVLETRYSRIPDERKEMYLDNSTRYGQFCVRDTTRQPNKSNLSTWQSLQKLSAFPHGSELDRTSIKSEKKTTHSEVAYQANTMTENSNVKNGLRLPGATPFSQVHAKFKSVKANSGEHNVQSESDSNNTRSRDGIQASDVLKDNLSRIESGYIYEKQDHPESMQVKSSKWDTSSETKMAVLYQKNVVSSANQKNIEQNLQVEQGCESERKLHQNLIYQLDQEANNRAVQYTEPPKVRNLSRFPVSQTVKERLEGNNLNRAIHLSTTESKSKNLLKQHALVAPEPFKRNVHISVIPKSEWNYSTSSDDGYTPISPADEHIKDLASVDESSQKGVQLRKTYTCQEIIKNTEVYESVTDSAFPEVDKIEYRKVVSVYYSLPRKFSRRISDLSKNNLKNIGKTLEQNRAPNALLDEIINRCHKEEPNSNLQNAEKTLTSITETIHSEEVHKVDDLPCKTPLLNFNILPLQTNLKNGSRPNSGEESDDLVNTFSSFHISENYNYTAKEDPKNKNEYSPSRSSPTYVPHTYYCTLPTRKSSLQDLERNVLERDIAIARDRFNIYSSSRNKEPSPPESQDVFTSPMFTYDNPDHSSRHDFMHFQENRKRDYNINNIFARDVGLYKQNSMDESLFLRQDLPTVYKSKSFKDLSQHKSYNTEDISPHMDCSTSPQSDYNSPVLGKNNDVINRTRPSYCSEFVQKKMKPINAKKFSYSFDHSGQDGVNKRNTGSYGDTVQISDADSPSVLYSLYDNYPSHVNDHFGHRSTKDCRDDTYSNLYRSKSMKFINTEGQDNFMDYKRKKDGSFSSKSYGGTLKSKSHSGDTWNRRLSAETLDENENWPISEETHERKPVCTSKSLDYGIFGKQQQEAILNNVKRALTQGRLWRPSFLKNPGFLRTEESCSQEIDPVDRSPDAVPPQGPNFKEFLNIYEDEPVVLSDSDTDTTTDDEYYLDENDKESEL